MGEHRILPAPPGHVSDEWIRGVSEALENMGLPIATVLPQPLDPKATPEFKGLKIGSQNGVAKFKNGVLYSEPISKDELPKPDKKALVAGFGSSVVVGLDGELKELTSAKEFKENIVPANQKINVTDLLRLNAKCFNYLGQDAAEEICFGFLADDVAEVSPDLVIFKNGKPYSIQYTEFIPLLLELLKDQNFKIGTQAKVIFEQKARLESLSLKVFADSEQQEREKSIQTFVEPVIAVMFPFTWLQLIIFVVTLGVIKPNTQR